MVLVDRISGEAHRAVKDAVNMNIRICSNKIRRKCSVLNVNHDVNMYR